MFKIIKSSGVLRNRFHNINIINNISNIIKAATYVTNTKIDICGIEESIVVRTDYPLDEYKSSLNNKTIGKPTCKFNFTYYWY